MGYEDQLAVAKLLKEDEMEIDDLANYDQSLSGTFGSGLGQGLFSVQPMTTGNQDTWMSGNQMNIGNVKAPEERIRAEKIEQLKDDALLKF